jgi:CheY-like chemotaxis protein
MSRTVCAGNACEPANRGAPRPRSPVLVVEDHEDTREMVEMFLRHEGYRVSAARHGVQALERIEREAPCLILLDVMMPVMDGVAFAEQLRASSDPAIAQTPIVLLTAVPNAREVQHRIGAVEVIIKPIPFDAVTDIIEHHCRR